MAKQSFLNARVYDARTDNLEPMNVLLTDGVITGVGYFEDEDTTEYNLPKHIIIPNITDSFAVIQDLDVEGETIQSASAAALNSGITTLACKYHKTADNPEAIDRLNESAKKESEISVVPIGNITRKAGGETLAEMGIMARNGAKAFSDGRWVENPMLMANALTFSKQFDIPLIIRPSHPKIRQDGVMNEGAVSTRLGLKGTPVSVETAAISRDIQLIKQTGGTCHFFPITAAASVELIRQAKNDGLNVTCGTAPHYLYLTEEDVEGYSSLVKVCPPARSKADQDALIQGLKDGTIDILASDHMPRLLDEKRTSFQGAAFGVSGLDYFLPLIINKLHHVEGWKLKDIFKLITSNPQKLLGLKSKGIALNHKPSFTVIDHNKEVSFSESELSSRGKNTPFLNQTFKGKATMAIVNGQLIKN